MQGFTVKSGITPKQILFATSPYMAVGVIASNEGVAANSEGRKIIKAGTPMEGSLKARETPFTVASSSPTKVAGVLLNDVDVTNGNENATLIIHGFVNLNNMDSNTVSLVTETVETALKGSVTFLK